MTNALAPLLDGQLAFLKEKLAFADDPREAVHGADLTDRTVLRDILARYGEAYPGQDPRAVASLWSKWHFAVVLEPALATNMLLDWALPTGLGDIGLIFTAEARAQALKVSRAGHAFKPATAEARFAALIDGHLEPVIAALAGETGITPRVLWSNAGNYFEHALRTVERATSSAQPGVVHAKALLASRTRADGRPNPLFEPVYYLDQQAETGRRRRICCIRYLIPEQKYCGACPIVRKDRASRDADERQAARART
ncbi:siderophore-iron reductase FhuF [Phreatobacter stygius]|uniref:Siderophore-iron reductase FhuF n=1 Tax=Phreatobacter stygius TaxID=1940610 RepID=A0A4D7BDA2_9HYPH|nr:siderophore-iron reductase FhuF [Phreatobacter stygius]QCI67346.1 siderophore-iron reductase FhuF [Phreatobacter stygius]